MLSIKTRQDMDLTVNGEQRAVSARPADTLLYTLREQFGLTGAKPGCENGDCGACTVNVDGLPVKSCMMLTAEAIGHDVQTVEGLRGQPIQDAFVKHFAFQCGYCTSGFLMVANALQTQHPSADEATMTEWLRSNICRCTGYEEIGQAVRSVLGRGEQTCEPPKKAPKTQRPKPVGSAGMHHSGLVETKR